MQHVSDTDELEHEAAPVVEQPELILLNKETGSAGLNAGVARVEVAARTLRNRVVIILTGTRRRSRTGCILKC